MSEPVRLSMIVHGHAEDMADVYEDNDKTNVDSGCPA